MTQLQLEFNKLREQERANRAAEAIKQQEADVKSKEADIKEAQLELNKVETHLKELKAPAEVQSLFSQADLNSANTQKALTQVNEVLANIDLLKSKTGLTQAEMQREQIALVDDFMSFLHRMVGVTYRGDMQDTIFDWIGGLMGGIGRGIGGLIG